MITQNERENEARLPLLFSKFSVFVACFDVFFLQLTAAFYDYKENEEPSSVIIILVSRHTINCNCFKCLFMIYCPKTIGFTSYTA